MEHIYVTPDDRLQKVYDEAASGSVIHLAPGVYRQKVVIRTPDLTIIGAGAGKTRSVYDDYARKRDTEGLAPFLMCYTELLLSQKEEM